MGITRTGKLTSVLCGAALFATLAVAAPPTMGDTAAAIEPTDEAKQAAYEKKSVCKKETVIGTRISKTVCQTRAQQDADRAVSQEYLKNVQDARRSRRKRCTERLRLRSGPARVR